MERSPSLSIATPVGARKRGYPKVVSEDEDETQKLESRSSDLEDAGQNNPLSADSSGDDVPLSTSTASARRRLTDRKAADNELEELRQRWANENGSLESKVIALYVLFRIKFWNVRRFIFSFWHTK